MFYNYLITLPLILSLYKKRNRDGSERLRSEGLNNTEVNARKYIQLQGRVGVNEASPTHYLGSSLLGFSQQPPWGNKIPFKASGLFYLSEVVSFDLPIVKGGGGRGYRDFRFSFWSLKAITIRRRSSLPMWRTSRVCCRESGDYRTRG